MASNLFCVICLIVFIPLTTSKPSNYYYYDDVEAAPEIINRSTWGAQSPILDTEELECPVPYVVIHYTSIPVACFNRTACSQAMRSMQYVHQCTNGWADIGYNFAVGSDGIAYEGRGWDVIGAHAPVYNSKSIGIVLIGHWVSELPPQIQLESTKQLINLGVRLGYIRPDYALIGHRQVRATECPGEALYQHMSTWDHFDNSIVFATDNNK